MKKEVLSRTDEGSTQYQFYAYKPTHFDIAGVKAVFDNNQPLTLRSNGTLIEGVLLSDFKYANEFAKMEIPKGTAVSSEEEGEYYIFGLDYSQKKGRIYNQYFDIEFQKWGVIFSDKSLEASYVGEYNEFDMEGKKIIFIDGDIIFASSTEGIDYHHYSEELRENLRYDLIEEFNVPITTYSDIERNFQLEDFQFEEGIFGTRSYSGAPTLIKLNFGEYSDIIPVNDFEEQHSLVKGVRLDSIQNRETLYTNKIEIPYKLDSPFILNSDKTFNFGKINVYIPYTELHFLEKGIADKEEIYILYLMGNFYDLEVTGNAAAVYVWTKDDFLEMNYSQKQE